MHGFRFAVAASAFVVAVSLVIHAEGTTQSQSVEIQLQLGNLFFGEGRYQESLEAYRNAVKVAPPATVTVPVPVADPVGVTTVLVLVMVA